MRVPRCAEEKKWAQPVFMVNLEKLFVKDRPPTSQISMNMKKET